MEKKKLGLSNKGQLELRKTVEGGTVKQSFSHGRVKSVAVEVKKVRTFKRNQTGIIQNTDLQKEKENFFKKSEIELKEKNADDRSRSSIITESNEDRLKKIKQAAHSGRIERESNYSSTDDKKFKNANPCNELSPETEQKWKTKAGVVAPAVSE